MFQWLSHNSLYLCIIYVQYYCNTDCLVTMLCTLSVMKLYCATTGKIVFHFFSNQATAALIEQMCVTLCMLTCSPARSKATAKNYSMIWHHVPNSLFAVFFSCFECISKDYLIFHELLPEAF
uniref:Uncharacterized protein n=1 Tax=Rhipicephalus microplus TaxID=6941 RepID=A0A6G5AHR0_RHIMP